MARFMGTVEGRAKTIASRLGTPGSGLTVYGNGWNCGGKIDMGTDITNEDFDIVTMSLTGGSNRSYLTLNGEWTTRVELNFHERDGRITLEVTDNAPIYLRNGQILEWSNRLNKYILTTEE